MPPHLIYGPPAAALAVTTALVATVCAVRPTRGLVTVTALIGQGGLGQLLLAGFNQNFVTPIAVSLALSVVLSLLLDSLIARVGYWLTPWAR